MSETDLKDLSLCIADVTVTRYILARLIVRIEMAEAITDDLESLIDFIKELSTNMDDLVLLADQAASSTRVDKRGVLRGPSRSFVDKRGVLRGPSRSFVALRG